MLLFLFVSTTVFAATSRTTYQAKIIKPDGLPLESASVNFRFSILDTAATCVLYSETYSGVNMSSTAGLISFSLGSGVRAYPVSATTFEQVFSNITPNMACDANGVPSAYTPAATDGRKIVMQFNDGGGWQTLPAMTINAVPYAMYANDAMKLNGLAASNFVQLSVIPTCGASEAIRYTGANFVCVAAGGGASVTSSTVITALGYTPADGVSVTALSGNISSVSSSVFSVSSTVNSLSSSFSSLQSSVAASFAALTSSQWITSGTAIHYSTGNVGIGTSAPAFPLEVAGDLAVWGPGLNGSSLQKFAMKSNSTGGWLEVPRDGSSNRLNFSVGWRGGGTPGLFINGASMTVGIGHIVPMAALDVSGAIRISYQATCSVSFAGSIRYNAGSVEYCNGTSWAAFGISGAGILTINGLTSGSQTFTTGISGTAPNISSVGSVHTFNFPSASNAATTAGLISYAEFLNFSNKQSATSAAIAATLGYVPADTVSLTTLSSTVSSLAATTTASLAAITSSQWVSSGTAISYNNGNVGIGTNNPATALEVSGVVKAKGVSLNDDFTTKSLTMDFAGAANEKVQLFFPAGKRLQGTYEVTVAVGYNGANCSGSISKVFSGYGRTTGTFSGKETHVPYASQLTRDCYTISDPLWDSTNTRWYFVIANLNASINRLHIHVKALTSVSDIQLLATEVQVSAPYTSDVTVFEKLYQNFAGNIGVGITNPTARLHLVSGTAAAGTAPLKFTSGTLLTSPQSGTMEYDGSGFYLTDGANVRRMIATGGSAGTIDNASVINATGSISLVPTTSVIVSATTAATNSQTGALVVKGGVGVAGNIFSSGTVTAGNGVSTTVINGVPTLALNPSGGNVGVNTAAPRQNLDVAPATGNAIVRATTTNAAAALQLYQNQGGGNYRGPVLWSNGTDLQFGHDTSENAGPTLMTLTTSGYLGVGTMAPSDILHVRKSVDARALIDSATGSSGLELRTGSVSSAGGGYIDFATSSTSHVSPDYDYRIISNTSGLNIQTPGGNPRFTVTPDGNVGIGTSTPNSKLQVNIPDNTPVYFGPNDGVNSNFRFLNKYTDGSNYIQVGVSSADTAAKLKFSRLGSSNNMADFRVNSDISSFNGSLGIGTSSPAHAMDLQGTIADFGLTRNVNSGAGPDIYFQKDRGTVGSPSVIQNGDVLGNISFRGFDGTSYTRGVLIQVRTTSATATGQMTADMIIRTNNGGADATERVRITGAGNFGIGTATPVSKLDVRSVSGAGDNSFRFNNGFSDQTPTVTVVNNNANGRAVGLLAGTNGTGITFDNGGVFSISTASKTTIVSGVLGSESTLLTVQASGRVGIGTTTPAGSLHVVAAVSQSNSPGQGIFLGRSLGDDHQIQITEVNGIPHIDLSRGTNADFDARIASYGNSMLNLGTASSAMLLNLVNQTVGIGTTTPTFGDPNLTTNNWGVLAVAANPSTAAGAAALTLANLKTPLASGDRVGAVHFVNTNNGTQLYSGFINVSLAGTGGANGLGAQMSFHTKNDNSVAIPQQMVIDQNGRVGINISGPTTTLQVGGVISPSVDNSYTLGTGALRFTAVYAVNGAIQTSDARQKKNITDSDLGLDFINKLRPVSYNWISGEDKSVHYGLIAQETERIVNESRQSKDGEATPIVDFDKESGRYGLRYTELISPIIKAIQEIYSKLMGHDEKIEAQERKVASLEADNKAKDEKIKELEQRLERIEKALNKK